MKVYLAARYSRSEEMRRVRDLLATHGHTVTGKWIDNHGGKMLKSFTPAELNSDPVTASEYAHADLNDILDADAVVSFTSSEGGGKGGRHVEFGVAVGISLAIGGSGSSGPLVAIVGPRENVFHCLRDVVVLNDIDQLIEWLNGWMI